MKHRESARRSSGTHGSGIRGARLEELIREEINSILDAEIVDRRLQSTRITRVELTRDGSRARLWFALSDDTSALEEVQIALQRASGFLRGRLCDGLPLKRIPDLSFRADPAARHWFEEELEDL